MGLILPDVNGNAAGNEPRTLGGRKRCLLRLARDHIVQGRKKHLGRLDGRRFAARRADHLIVDPVGQLAQRARKGIDGSVEVFARQHGVQGASQACHVGSRGIGGQYTKKPDLGSFKESGDIEYSADNAMILIPNWDPIDPISTAARESTLWMAASRENNPGKIGVFRLEYPYWSFIEV